MKRSSLFTAIALSLSAVAYGESVEYLNAVIPVAYNNPISPLYMCADPTSIEYNGRIYLYGSNDQQEYDGNGGTGDNTYGKIKSLVVLSTTDMINWTHHGTIDMAKACGSWMGNSWAPSIASRVEDDGLTHFYLYFANGGGGVGVVTSTSPTGPWTAPLNRTLISHGTPGLGECCWPFDPGVVIDDEGTGWLSFGGGDPISTGSKLFPGNSRLVKLGPDMVSFASDIITIPAPYHFEANELNIINGKFVYTYCSGWGDRNDWRQYQATGSAPSTCSMCYLVSDDPLNPDSWQWGGECLPNPGNFGYPWGNNHTHMQKYNGEYYMFYHTQVMENIAGIKGAYRSLGVNKIDVDEENWKIAKGTMTNGGAPVIKEHRPNAYERQQAEMIANAAGVKVQSVGDEGNAVINKIQPGGWVSVKNVDFGDGMATQFSALLRGKGRLAIIPDNIKFAPVGMLEFNSSLEMKEYTVELTSQLKGVHNIYFVFTEANSTARFDEWQFIKGESEGISDIEVAPAIVSDEYYTVSGVRVDNPQSGLFIRRTLHADGSVTTDKVIK